MKLRDPNVVHTFLDVLTITSELLDPRRQRQLEPRQMMQTCFIYIQWLEGFSNNSTTVESTTLVPTSTPTQDILLPSTAACCPPPRPKLPVDAVFRILHPQASTSSNSQTVRNFASKFISQLHRDVIYLTTTSRPSIRHGFRFTKIYHSPRQR